MSKEKPVLNEDDQHDLLRARAGRAGWINWRMRDVPAIYADLMPTSCDGKELLDAERCIRVQIAEDQKHLSSPWRQGGPACHLLDMSGFTGTERYALGLELEPFLGMPDAYKRGQENHPDVQAALNAAKDTPEYQREMAKQEALKEVETAMAEWRADESDDALQRVKEAEAKYQSFFDPPTFLKMAQD